MLPCLCLFYRACTLYQTMNWYILSWRVSVSPLIAGGLWVFWRLDCCQQFYNRVLCVYCEQGCFLEMRTVHFSQQNKPHSTTQPVTHSEVVSYCYTYDLFWGIQKRWGFISRSILTTDLWLPSLFYWILTKSYSLHSLDNSAKKCTRITLA